LDVAGAARLGLEVVLGDVPVDAAGEQRGRGAKISADEARALCGMCGSSVEGRLHNYAT